MGGAVQSHLYMASHRFYVTSLSDLLVTSDWLDEGRIVAALTLSEKKWVAWFEVTSTWPLLDSM